MGVINVFGSVSELLFFILHADRPAKMEQKVLKEVFVQRMTENKGVKHTGPQLDVIRGHCG